MVSLGGLYRLPRTDGDTAAGIYVGAVVTVVTVIGLAIWTATQYAAYRLAFHSALGRPLFWVSSPYRGGLAAVAVVAEAVGGRCADAPLCRICPRPRDPKPRGRFPEPRPSRAQNGACAGRSMALAAAWAPLDFPLRGKVYDQRVMNGGLKIGELARRTGVTAKAIRFYERKGVLPLAERAPNGYRLYDAEAVGMLHFVKQASGLGLTLAEIKEIVAIRQGGRPPCTHVHQLLRVKASELDRKLKDLVEVRKRIRRSLSVWGRRPQGRAPV